MLFVARPAGWLADKFPARIVSTIGAGLLMIGLFVFVGLDASSSIYIILFGLFLAGVGMALFSTPNTTAIMGSVRKAHLGSASGILATIRTLGIALGAGLSIAIFSYYQNIFIGRQIEKIPAFMSSYQSVYKIMLIIIAIGVVFSALRGDIMNNQGQSRAERH
jgi:MFS family permease